jgi:hypothetical protein
MQRFPELAAFRVILRRTPHARGATAASVAETIAAISANQRQFQQYGQSRFPGLSLL